MYNSVSGYNLIISKVPLKQSTQSYSQDSKVIHSENINDPLQETYSGGKVSKYDVPNRKHY